MDDTALKPNNTPNSMLRQSGTRIVDADGKPVTLRGVNLGGWLLWEGWIFGQPDWPIFSISETTLLDGLTQLISTEDVREFRSEIYERFITKEDIRQISLAGFNTVRVPLNHRLFTPKNEGWAKLKQLLQWCKENGIYAVIDLHAAPGGQSTCWCADPQGVEPSLPPRPGPLWSSEKYQDETIARWQRIAEECNGDATVAGYDLLNEPEPPSGNALVTYYERLIHAVREVDPNHLIFLEGSDLSTDFSMFKRPPCENMVYSFHIYSWAGDKPAKLKAYQSISTEQNIPFWVGEFGEGKRSWIEEKVKYFTKQDSICGWCFWTWKKADNGMDGLVKVKIDDDWESTMSWVKNRWPPKPTASTVKSGMREFGQNVGLENTPDKAMLKAILNLK